MFFVYFVKLTLGHSKSTYAPIGVGGRVGGGDTLKAYENVQGEGGGKCTCAMKNSVGRLSPHISMINPF